MASDLCWICNKNVADSREHKVKKTDIRAVIGAPTQAEPAYHHSVDGRNRHVRSVDADIVKFSHDICQKCNNTVTQPHDKSWDTLSEALLNRKPEIAAGVEIQAKEIFPQDTDAHLSNVQLHIAKHFGCFLNSGRGQKPISGGEPIEDAEIDKILQSLSAAIQSNKPHPDIYLIFGPTPFAKLETQVGNSNLEVVKCDGQVNSLCCYRHVGKLSVGILYDPYKKFHDPNKVWHPLRDGERIKIVGIKNDGRERAILQAPSKKERS